MASLNKACILIILNDPVSYWCDYVYQTVKYLSEKNSVIVFCSENVITWRDLFSQKKHTPLFEKKWKALLFHPFFIIPGQRFPMIKMLNYQINAFCLHWYIFLIQPRIKKIFWFFDPLYIVAIKKFFTRYISVYDCVDYYAEISKALQMNNRLLLAKSTYVFANSYALVHKLRPYRATITLVPLGFAQDLFRKKRKSLPRDTAIIAGFVGGITRRIDYALLTSVVKLFPDIHFVFYGECRSDVKMSNGTLSPDVKKFFMLKNVFWKGPVLKKDVPSVISSFDICLIPYTKDAFNTYCFPMKVMEYFYMGKPILSSPIKELQRFPKHVYIGATVEEWEYHIWRILSKPWLADFQTEQRKIAEQNSWQRKLSQLTAFIQ